jgi:hypothetical protein
MTNKETKIINALKGNKGKSMSASEVAAATAIPGGELAKIVKGMMEDGLVVKDPNDGKRILAAKAKAPAPQTSAKPSKPAAVAGKKVPARRVPEPEPEVEDEVEDEVSDEYTEAELDAFYEEYQELADKGTLNSKDKKRFADIEEILEDAGYFGPDEGEEATEEETGEEEEFGEDETETEEEFEFGDEDETEGEHSDADDEDVPAQKGKGGPYMVAFKPIDTLSKKELNEAIEECSDLVQQVEANGYTWGADFLSRSIAKARKQLNKRG